jgi:CheY-like chemotaxis protein
MDPWTRRGELGSHVSDCMPPKLLSDLIIVIVEDHDDARRYLGAFLRQLGADVILARDAIQGIEAIRSSRPHLVVSDIQMPGADGFELLRQIRALGSDSGNGVPVISMTAFLG